MKTKDDHSSVVNSELERSILLRLTQPVTSTQLARRLGISLDRCSNVLAGLLGKRLIRCLNPAATRSRLYWLTKSGRKCQREMDSQRTVISDIPDIDWKLYGTICFSHRSEVIRTLTAPMQPAQIKRRAAFRKPGLRMSANNVRDVIHYLKTHGVVRPIPIKKRAHPCYELTEIGQHFQRLLLQVEAIR